MTKRQLMGLVSLAALSGCSHPHPGVSAPTRQLVRSDGAVVGQVQIFDEDGGSRIHIEATGLPPGVHGVHLHAVGRCDAPAFASAGPHWNPTHRQHGHDNPAGYHGGDLGNVSVGADGSLDTDLIATDVRLVGDPESTASTAPNGRGAKGLVISDNDGTAFVIHASPDDERTDPSGNSGARIACAVVAAPR